MQGRTTHMISGYRGHRANRNPKRIHKANRADICTEQTSVTSNRTNRSECGVVGSKNVLEQGDYVRQYSFTHSFDLRYVPNSPTEGRL